MRSTSVLTAGKANLPAEAAFRVSGTALQRFEGIPRLCRQLWPEKTAENLAARTGTSDRACRDILAKRGIFSSPALVALLHSEDGFPFLQELMGSADVTWWKWAERAVHLGDLRRKLEEQRKAIEQYEFKLAEEMESGRRSDR